MKRAVAAFIAGVVLASGVATAATHYLITNVNQIKPSVRAQLKGHRGPRGPRGPQGIQGPAAVVSRPAFVTTTIGNWSANCGGDGGSHCGPIRYVVSCPASTYAVIGGIVASGGGLSEAGYSTNNDQAWEFDTTPQAPTVEVFAICAA